MLQFIASLILLAGLFYQNEALRGDYSGCFQHSGDSSFARLVNATSAADSPQNCISSCLSLQYKYAGLLNGQQCYCSATTGSAANETCSVPCTGNSTLTCGGNQTISAYETGVTIAGPPISLTLINKTENSLQIKWEPPVIPNVVIQEYQVSAVPMSSYSLSSVASPMEWLFPNSSLQQDLLGLQPGTNYNVSVRAKTLEGYGTPIFQTFSTEIGTPDKPQAPIVTESVNRTVTVQLKPVLPTLGPISAYQIIVLNEDNAAIGINKGTVLKSMSVAAAENLTQYITAELKPEEFKQEFTIGDRKFYQGFSNAPLPNDREVVFVLGVKSSYEGVTKVSYSEPSKPIGTATSELEPPSPPDSQQPNQQQQPPVVIEEDARDSIIKLLKDTDLESRIPVRINKPIINGRGQAGGGRSRKRIRYRRDPPALVIGLSIAVGISASLLVLSIFVYFYLKHKVHRSDLYRRGRGRRPLDKQGLTMYGGSTSTIELETGYVHSSFVMGIEETPVDHYESLMQRLWTIPTANVIQTKDILGTGHYGPITKGSVQRGDTKIDAALQSIEDNSLASGTKQSMLKDLGQLVKVGQHANIAGIIGVCEEPDKLLVAMEYYGTTLKEFLLSSRALNNYPSYAEKEQRFSTLHEAQAIDIALGIAKGMAYLQSLSVPHTRLTSRTVLVCNGTEPKIFGFGMDYYQQAGHNYDFKRWVAPEALTSPQHAPKCEVWSFAVILWEIVTLGATPYVEVRSKELTQRVQRGLRLKQPTNIGVPFFQIMVSCWQIDLDERPTFQELVDILQQAFNQSLDYLSFNLFPEFNYERYDPSVELNR